MGKQRSVSIPATVRHTPEAPIEVHDELLSVGIRRLKGETATHVFETSSVAVTASASFHHRKGSVG